jgi:hypothetical protein
MEALAVANVDPDDSLVMTPLAKLLRDRMDEKRWKLQDVTRPPEGKRDGGPARSTMRHYLQPGNWLRTMPRPKAIEELATAMRLDKAAIQQAAYQSLMSNRGKDPELLAAPHHADDADDEIRYQRPEGLTDAEWERMKRTANAQLRALFEEYEQ